MKSAVESWLSTVLNSPENDRVMPKTQSRRLLVVRTKDGAHTKAVKDYVLLLSRRLDCEVVLLTLTASEPPGYNRAATDKTSPFAPPSTSGLTINNTGEEKILVECHANQNDVSSTVSLLCREIKRIEFILTDSDVIKDILSETAVIPVFRIVADIAHPKGGFSMSTNSATIHKKPVGKTIVFGLLTAAFYAAVFWRADMLMKFFTRGGYYAAFPIATAIAFSFVHGAFASNLWSMLGIQARSRTEAYKTISPAAPPPKAKVKRPRVYAYVNPFHNIDIKR